MEVRRKKYNIKVTEKFDSPTLYPSDEKRKFSIHGNQYLRVSSSLALKILRKP